MSQVAVKPQTALILVDFQNDYFPSFPGAKLPLVGTEVAADNGAQLLDAFRSQGLPVVHVHHEFPSEQAPFFVAGSDGASIHTSVQPKPEEVCVLKHKVNSFVGTNLDHLLKELNVSRLFIAGAMSHMCIDSIVRAATDLGYECFLAHDACATQDLEFNGVTVSAEQVHAAYMAALSSSYCLVDTTQTLLGHL